ncbi:MAG TPA: flagellar basal-body MS-ring/collar protein FliF [Noviherbaspirillum sp.]|uniref:flagellar basal-body MS-ring/collar protein FliF n=1 Tax=Noviherbaspirillum sp. TaxID=1926288 RepID=UPI002B4A9D60|nr:flagellar basal-body MS-ring/collar protein FliF [Noviherbaspirillum sp.]HJV88503.1 flagellar basal-body MS-ring/collar protein FliF [Noviherbaspirillum sp.]
MAVAGENAVAPAPSGIVGFAQTPGGRNFFLMLGVAAVAGVMAGIWLWSQQPDYRVLFSNFSDRDGGAIVSSLQQMNVPYKFAEGGGAILVPSNQVHDVRLKLASQGLPKGGNVGFELMENQKLGVSQFLEQVNFQRALEGELARSIQSLSAVQAARVHLALPKASVFIRDQQKPTASVLLNLHPGRTLDEQQVSGIVHLVASSVPDLPTKNVTIVDQNGNLLSETRAPGSNGLDASQLKYVQELQQSIVKRIESILTPILGANNVRAEATADIDFSHTEQAAESYKPNQAPNTSAIRSQQLSETQSSTPTTASGVPGALTNQPPAPSTAPLTAPAAPAAGNGAGAAAGASSAAPANAHKDMTVNYEVDKTVRYTQQPMGGIQRLSVAVVVNYKREVGKDGKVSMKPLSDAEKAQITDLVKEAMGFNKDRGDSLNVVNSPFAGAEKEVIPETPIWKRPETLNYAMGAGKYIAAAAILAYLFFAVLKPLLRKIAKTFEPPEPPPEVVARIEHEVEPMGSKASTYQDNLEAAKQLAKNDPKMVANVVKAWVGNE